MARKSGKSGFPVTRNTLLNFAEAAREETFSGRVAGIPFRELAGSRFFQHLSPEAIRAILNLARRRGYRANSIIFQQEASADRFYMVRTGQARYFYLTPGGKKLILTWLRAGEIFGINAVMPARSTYLVSAESLHESELLIWEKDVIRGLAKRYPRLWENIMQTASDYLEFYIATHVGLVSRPARERVADLLITLAMRLGRASSDGIELQITNQELADTTNLTHFTVSRLMREWQKKAILEKRRGGIVIHSPSQLLVASQAS